MIKACLCCGEEDCDLCTPDESSCPPEADCEAARCEGCDEEPEECECQESP